MRARIIQTSYDGMRFAIQYRPWWWPIWRDYRGGEDYGYEVAKGIASRIVKPVIYEIKP